VDDELVVGNISSPVPSPLGEAVANVPQELVGGRAEAAVEVQKGRLLDHLGDKGRHGPEPLVLG
jgi:hypothetical protein